MKEIKKAKEVRQNNEVMLAGLNQIPLTWLETLVLKNELKKKVRKMKREMRMKEKMKLLLKMGFEWEVRNLD